MQRLALSALMSVAFALPLAAQTVPTEASTLAGQQVTLHLHPFLTAEDLAILRTVATNEQALALFLTRPGRHGAIAVAPGEGFVRGGQPVASAAALSDLASAAEARQAATDTCQRARRQGPDCVVVLEVAPAR